MTIDEVIKYAEEMAEENNKRAEHIRDKMESEIALSNATECETCAKKYRQLAEWLKELQIYRRNLTNQSISDLLVQSENENERLHNRMNELEKELQNHKEAWEKVEKELKKEDQRFTNKTNFASGYIEGIREALCKINEYRLKEGDVDGSTK